MMVWIGLGLIVFVVMLWVWRHTYTDRHRVYEREKQGYFWDDTPYHYEYRDEDRLPMPRWVFMLLFVGCVVPIVNLVCLFLGAYFYTTLLIDEDLYFHLKGNKFTKAMAEFFTKDIYARRNRSNPCNLWLKKTVMKEKTSGGVGIMWVLFVVFLVLKLCKVIEWSWLWVFSPLWIVVTFGVLLIIIAYIVKGYYTWRMKRRKK